MDERDFADMECDDWEREQEELRDKASLREKPPARTHFIIERYHKDQRLYLWGVRYSTSPRYWKSYMYLNENPAVIFRYVWLRIQRIDHRIICRILGQERRVYSRSTL